MTDATTRNPAIESHGPTKTPDLMGTFSAHTSTQEIVPLTAERRAQLIEELIEWSRGNDDATDWEGLRKLS